MSEMGPTLKSLDDEAQRVHEAALWASETQFANCKIWRTVDRAIGVSTAIVASVAGVGGLADIISAQWAGGVAIASAALGTVSASLGAGRNASESMVAGNLYRSLQQDVRVYRTIDLVALSVADARKALGKLICRQQDLNVSSPVPLSVARRMAHENIERGGQIYQVDQR